MNNLSITGRLGGDPELKEVNGTSLVKFGVAEDHGYGTNWINVELWGDAAETVAEYFSKGDGIELNGVLEMDEGDDGRRYYKLRAYNWGFPVGGSSTEEEDDEDDDAPF